MDETRFLHLQALECRRAAGDMADGEAKRGLEQLARHYEREARRVNVVEVRARG